MKKVIAYSLLTICLIIFLVFYSIEQKYRNINAGEVRDSMNKVSLPIIESNSRYIELQTKEWIKKRENKKPCFGMLEKDKVIMATWMEHFKIDGPKIHYYDYYYNFTLAKLKEVIDNNKNKRLVAKISHLQSNYGIIIIEPNITNQEIIDIYKKCQKLFSSCFVCNHDKNDPPGKKEITKRKKESYYKLYETVEPGIVIQDFFYSYDDNKINKPMEIKVLVFADKIINLSDYVLTSNKRLELVYAKAREISNLLGAHLIRVDFFVKSKDNPYIPYLNEISLSPNGGMYKNFFISSKLLNQYREEIKNYRYKEYKFVNELIEKAPYRTNEILYYLSDNDSVKEKFAF